MKKKILKYFIVFIAIINIICLMANISYGFGINDLTGTQPKGAGTVKNAGNAIIGIIAIIGSAVSIIVLMILGIKYMLGSLEERAEYKKTMFAYFVGAIFVFSASAIAGFVYKTLP